MEHIKSYQRTYHPENLINNLLMFRVLPAVKELMVPRECVECEVPAVNQATQEKTETPECPEIWDFRDHPDRMESRERPEKRDRMVRYQGLVGNLKGRIIGYYKS